MSLEVTVKDTQPAIVAFAAMKGPFSLISETFGKLYGWIGQKGYVPSGPPVGVYFSDPKQVAPEELLWELRSPIAGEVPESGPSAEGLGVKRVQPVQVAATLYKGPYEKIEPVYAQMVGWIMQNGYQAVGPPQEVYLSDPAQTAPADLLTELQFPVQKS